MLLTVHKNSKDSSYFCLPLPITTINIYAVGPNQQKRLAPTQKTR